MSTVLVLTPIVIGSWPMLSAAIVGAVASMGFSVIEDAANLGVGTADQSNRVETEVANSEVVKESMKRGQKMVVERNGIRIEFTRDERGACKVCASGKGVSKAELSKLAEEVAGRVVQQFAYHKLMTELKKRNYAVIDESMTSDQSIQIRVRAGR